MKHKKTAIALFALLVASFLVGCVQASSASDSVVMPALDRAESINSVASAQGLSPSISDMDRNSSWSDADTKISLNGSSATVSGTGATASGSVVTITAEGTYVVSGSLSDGQIAIAAANTDKVHLVLNGVDIISKTGAPVYASQCDKLIITLADKTENSLTDGGSNFQYADTVEKEPNAALFCKDDLTINGGGALTVKAGFNNGIVSKDDLLIVSGDLSVTAANHGLRGNDSVTILSGNLAITAGNDGIQTNNTKDSALGWILIENAAVAITAGHDGIQADTSIKVSGGTFSIATGFESSSDTPSDSYKGIKAATDIAITDGVFRINSEDDGIHADGNITIDGGSFTISTGDDGIHADGYLTINAGTIEVTESYEGLEAANIVITGGEIDLTSSDDAINAAGGADQRGGGGRFGQDRFATAGAYSVSISGGTITLSAGGDGIDSNGTIEISGGSIEAIINSTPDNGALDADGGITFTGGTIIYGGTGIGPAPGSSSTQSYVLVNSSITAGTEITVKKDEQTLIAYQPTASLQYLALSSPAIQSGESYEIYSAGSLLSTVAAGDGGSGMGPGWEGPGWGGAPGGEIPRGEKAPPRG